MPDLYFFRDQDEIEKDEEVAQKAAQEETEAAPQDWSAEVSGSDIFVKNNKFSSLLVQSYTDIGLSAELGFTSEFSSSACVTLSIKKWCVHRHNIKNQTNAYSFVIL